MPHASLHRVRALLIDLDGVVYTGNRPIGGAQEAIAYLEEHGIPHLFVSNSTRRCRESIAEKLGRMGLRIPCERILTPAIVAARHLAERGIRRCHLVSIGDVHRDFEKAGVEITSGEAQVVVVGDAGDNFTYQTLTKAFRLLIDGATLIALERDRYWMGEDGLQLSAGPFVTGLEYASGAKAEVAGKPSPGFFQEALRILGACAEETAMIGDDIMTDIGGAKACGMMGILVRTGKFDPASLAGAGFSPDLCIGSIAELPYLL